MLQEIKNAGGGGHSKTQEIGQNNTKTIHNDITYDKLNKNQRNDIFNDIDNLNCKRNSLTTNIDNESHAKSVNEVDSKNTYKKVINLNTLDTNNKINKKLNNAHNITEIEFARDSADYSMRANNGGNEMRKQDRYNEISEIRAETSIDNNSGLFVNTNVANTNYSKNIANKANSTVHNIDTASVINATTNNKVSNASSTNVVSNAICAKTKVDTMKSKNKTNTLTNREEKVLSRAQALHKRAGYIRPRVLQSVSIGAQHTNTLMRSTVQLVLWLLAFVLSTMIVYFTNTNNGFNMNNGVIAVESTPDDGTTSTGFAGGTGDPDNPYQIATPMQLRYLSQNQSTLDLSKSYTLTADIVYECDEDVEATARWTTIGTEDFPFGGAFDGNGHSITFTQTIHITSSSGIAYGGVFGVANFATISNLGVNWQLGLEISSSAAYAGGIAGYAYISTISNCYNTGAVSAVGSMRSYAGGISGWHEDTEISDCYNTGAVTATDSSSAYAGGISGHASYSTTITNCYNTGSLSATASNNAYAGGIVADDFHGTNDNCYYLNTCGGSGIGESKTKEDLQKQDTYTNWDFTTIWGINAGANSGYPILIDLSNVTITYQIDKDDSSQNVTDTYNFAQSANITLKDSSTFTKTGYKYTQWTDGTNYYDCNSAQFFDKDITLYPVWEIDAYTITFDITTNGGSGNAPTAQTVNAGDSVQFPTGNYKSGWTFVGWNTDANAKTALPSYTPTGNVTLYAIYSKVLTANFYQLDGTNDAETIIIYNNETSGQITAPTISTSGVSGNPQVVGWASSNTSINSSLAQNTSTTISGNVNYYAVVSYTVTISYNGNGHTGGSAVASSTGTAYKTASGNSTPNITKSNITIAQNTFTKDNYTFIGWADSTGATSGKYTIGTAYEFESDKTLYAVWQSNYVGVTFNITTNVGVIFNVYDNLGNFVQQIYVGKSKNNAEQTISTQLLKGVTYTIRMSANYTTNIVSASGATQQGRELLLTISDSGNIITIKVTGFNGGNGIVV